METDVSLHTVVRCVDGIAGTSTAVILDPKTRAVTHVVVRERDGHKVERLVPIELVDRTSEDGIQLRCRSTALQTMDRFVERGFVELPEQDRYGTAFAHLGSAFLWPRRSPEERVIVAHERVPKDELAIRRGAEVDATDGPVGSVEAFLVEAGSDLVTHVVVRSGHLDRTEFAVPASEVSEITSDRIVLRLDRFGVKRLPRVPYHHLAIGPGLGGVRGTSRSSLWRTTGISWIDRPEHPNDGRQPDEN